MTGTVAQVEWAARIKTSANAEFDRVAACFRVVASGQSAPERADTEAIIAILEQKRAEVMNREDAGYFIRDWQEIGDQVRRMIGQDAEYRAIGARKVKE